MLVDHFPVQSKQLGLVGLFLSEPMIGENWQLVTNEPVEFEK